MIYYLYVSVCIVLTACGQVLLKMGTRNRSDLSRIYLNPYTLTGYGLIALVTIFTVLALGGISLKLLYVLMSLNYILIILLSRFVLDERISLNRAAAVVLIFAGVIIFNL